MSSQMENGLEVLSEYNRWGILAFPQESLENYCMRASKIANCEKNSSIAETVWTQLKELYDIEPRWIDVVFSNKGLHFFEAGCTWIDLENAEILVQLKKVYEVKNRLFFLYDKNEVLAHEFVHAVRAPLQSEKFEEFFAYHVSSNSPFSVFRKLIGPLFRSPYEAMIVLFASFVPFFSQATFFSEAPFYKNVLLIVPFLVIFSYFFRLALSSRTLKKARQFLENYFLTKGIEKNVWPIMMRLTDDEIRELSALKLMNFSLFVEEKRQNSLRWQMLIKQYF